MFPVRGPGRQAPLPQCVMVCEAAGGDTAQVEIEAGSGIRSRAQEDPS